MWGQNNTMTRPILTYFIAAISVLQSVTAGAASSDPSPARAKCLPAPGAVSWWSGNNTIADSIGLNSGTLLNGATFTPGFIGKAFKFDGVDDQFIALSIGMPVGNADRTIEGWVR